MSRPERALDLSLLFFSGDGASEHRHKYRLLFEAAKFADDHGLCAVWTPERHFRAHGGLFPNPAVTSAALAVLTRRVHIRAGSVVLPLHDPIRVAEEWAVVDNLSGGRVGIAIASGWHPADFVLTRQAYDQRRSLLESHIAAIRTLWSGQSIQRRDASGRVFDVGSLPRPLQPTLPMWLTSTGDSATWDLAGRLGLNVLTALVAQPEEALGVRIAHYRDTRHRHGHDQGRVTLMLHTHIDSDERRLRALVEPALTNYLVGFLTQLDMFTGRPLTRDERRALVAPHVRRYFEGAALLGPVDKCVVWARRFRALGVDEIACFIDFGVDETAVLEGLRHIETLHARI